MLRLLIMDKLQLTRQNLGQVFIFRNGCAQAVNFLCYRVKPPNSKAENSAQTTFSFSPGNAITNGRDPISCLGRVFNSKLGCIAT